MSNTCAMHSHAASSTPPFTSCTWRAASTVNVGATGPPVEKYHVNWPVRMSRLPWLALAPHASLFVAVAQSYAGSATNTLGSNRYNNNAGTAGYNNNSPNYGDNGEGGHGCICDDYNICTVDKS
eukprot:g24945.t1